jgi:hypothetical protein
LTKKFTNENKVVREKLENSLSQIVSIHEEYEQRMKNLIEEKNCQIENFNQATTVLKNNIRILF